MTLTAFRNLYFCFRLNFFCLLIFFLQTRGLTILQLSLLGFRDHIVLKLHTLKGMFPSLHIKSYLHDSVNETKMPHKLTESHYTLSEQKQNKSSHIYK